MSLAGPRRPSLSERMTDKMIALSFPVAYFAVDSERGREPRRA